MLLLVHLNKYFEHGQLEKEALTMHMAAKKSMSILHPIELGSEKKEKMTIDQWWRPTRRCRAVRSTSKNIETVAIWSRSKPLGVAADALAVSHDEIRMIYLCSRSKPSNQILLVATSSVHVLGTG